MANTSDAGNWGENANCYAYAMSCPNATSASKKTGGTAIPGVATGKKATPMGDAAAYSKALITGVESDGGEFAGADSSAIPAPKAGSYLIAGFANGWGFHFTRRDPSSRQWSWLDGNESPVMTKVYDTKSKKEVTVTEALMKQIIDGGSPLSWRYDNMKFFGFFWVPSDGRQVKCP